MKVLADFHHHDLFESLQIVFRDRFGWDLYRPIGMEWFDEGWWNFEREWHGDAVARQYLTPWGDDVDHGTHSTRIDPSHPGRDYRMVTVEQARALRPDVVIASVAHNHEGLSRFADEVGATFGIHLGNVRFSVIDMAEDRWDLARFGILTTTSPTPPPRPHVTVHQEFSLTDFRAGPPPRSEPFTVASFVNCFPETAWAYDIFRSFAGQNRDMAWRVYGAYGSAPTDEWAAGNLRSCPAVGDAMRASDIAFHLKRWSDGFGHVIHDWFAVGRPVFGWESYYRDQLAGPLWVDGVTSFDIERRAPHEVNRLLRRIIGDEDYHLRLCENAAMRFREVVDFDADAEAIRTLIESVA
jgi:hypothetical protein